MQYRSIVLELLEQRPKACERLKEKRMMLKAVDTFGLILKLNHEAIIKEMQEANPDRDPTQIKQAAFEIALNYLQKALPSESDPDFEPEQFLDSAEQYITPDMPIA